MSMIGNRVVRREDPNLLTVGGMFVADVGPDNAAHVTFVRSTMAHALLTEVDVSKAAGMPGVVAVHTAESLGLSPQPPPQAFLNQEMTRTWLAKDRVRFVGEPIAAIVSETVEAGVDAAEMVVIDYDPLDAVVSIADSLAESTLLFPDVGTNVPFGFPSDVDGDIFADCEITVELTFGFPRINGAPIETRAVISEWGDVDGVSRLTQWSCTQFPHGARDGLAKGLGVEPGQVHVITPDVGGGFGAKNGQYPEDFVVAELARRLDRPMRWNETRSESMLNLAHARSLENRVKLGGSREGDITAYQCHMIQDAGAYPVIGAVLPFLSKIVASGTYDIPNVSFSAQSVVTNTTPIGAYRGAGRPEATLALERIIDVFAAEIDMDPAELRRKNLWQPDQFPLKTPTGADMDSGEYEAAIDLVMTEADYPALRAEQARRRNDPTKPLLGLGWCVYVEIANPMGAGEFGSMQVKPDGSAIALTGSSAHGQGHDTAFAQVASEVTGIAFDKIEVRHGDTDEVKRGGGTGGSRSLQVGGSAIHEASTILVEQAKEIAANILEASVDDIVLDTGNGQFAVAGVPAKSLEWGQIAEQAEAEAEDSVFLAETDFKPPAATFPFGAHLSVVEVDRDTGEVTPIRHISCDDAGVIVNPTIVEGQVHGGVSSGIAMAVMETFTYDEWGNPLTGNFMDYALPAATEFPSFERIPLETPTDRNPIGAKGIGESGTIGATPAVQNAVVDALSHLGVTHIELPVAPQNVWRTMNEAS